MTRALTNLAINGIYWAPAGGEVHISGCPAPGEEDWATIRVRDNGAGIQPGQREKLFRLFYSTRADGHGIGLANVKKIVEYHDGFVAAGNDPERGAAFTMLLPKAGPEA
jgi:signal transduction histidine kinase